VTTGGRHQNRHPELPRATSSADEKRRDDRSIALTGLSVELRQQSQQLIVT
jgi:hypothetical protein